jgi:hypothetical protein
MDDSDCSDGAAEDAIGRSPHRWRNITVMVLAVAVAAVLSIWATVWRMPGCPLSSIDPVDVASIQVDLWGRDESTTRFFLERKLIPDLLSFLKSCPRDWNPAKWQKLGLLRIEMKDGSRCTVNLYDSYEEFAAFSIDRRYYRGGSNRDLKRLLRVDRERKKNENGDKHA